VNALRLCLGTLTVLPVRPPRSVDRRTAGWAMVLAPVAGLVPGLVMLGLAWLLAGSSVPALVTAVLVVAVPAVLSRALHLDGLADTADGLGSRRPAAEALDVMRHSDIGPFGVVTLTLVLLLQVGCAEELAQGGPYSLGLLAATAVVSRATLPLLCSTRVRPARSDGLGAVVVGTVGWRLMAAAGVVTAVTLGVVVLVALGVSTSGLGGTSGPAATSMFPGLATQGVALVVLPLGAAALLARHCVTRFGGVTGDVLGAAVETASTTALLVAVL
jgi:adenosylcobinamide-GDP ribazoletransferase